MIIFCTGSHKLRKMVRRKIRLHDRPKRPESGKITTIFSASVKELFVGLNGLTSTTPSKTDLKTITPSRFGDI